MHLSFDASEDPEGRRAERSRNKAIARFLTFYPGGFDDPDYNDLERGYKERAHRDWRALLSEEEHAKLLAAGRHDEVAARAVRIEGRTNLLFSFEKMALRDAVRSKRGARLFAEGSYDLLHGEGPTLQRFERWLDVVERLPRVNTRVFTWPVVTVFPFLADPKRHLYLKPTVTKAAAAKWAFPFRYSSRPSIETYASLLAFGRDVKTRLAHSRFPGRRARDSIDVQGFLWVLGSSEYD